jgi:type IV pilus assembly protein PilM
MRTTIGLDVGSTAVRAVQLSSSVRGAAKIQRMGQVALPVGAVRDGEIQEPDTVADAIRALWSQTGLKGRKVALGVANQQVVVRPIELPYLPEKDLRQALQFQVQDHIPFPVEQAVLDYHLLEEYETDEGAPFTRLLLVAAQKAMIDALIRTVRQARLKPVLIDLGAFALLRDLATAQPLEQRGADLIIDVGGHVTNIIIHQDGAPKFVRILKMGGHEITAALVDGLDISYEDAEERKAEWPGFSAASADEATPLIADHSSRFVEEIRGSVDYYSTQVDALAIERVLISGGGSQLPGLADRLAETLRLPVDRGHPMQELAVGGLGLDQDELVGAEPYLSTAVGLAMGAAE